MKDEEFIRNSPLNRCTDFITFKIQIQLFHKFLFFLGRAGGPGEVGGGKRLGVPKSCPRPCSVF